MREGRKEGQASKVKKHGGQRCDIIGALSERREMSQRQHLKNNSCEFY